MSKFVLDASAILILLNNEPGAHKVAKALPRSIISAVNVWECAAVLGRVGMPTSLIPQTLAEILPPVIPFDERQAYETAALRKQTKAYDLSFGGRACLALAKVKGREVLTANKTWLEFTSLVPVHTLP